MPRSLTDEELKQHAANLVIRMMGNAADAGHEPEGVWLLLQLAADGAERALLYASGILKAQATAEFIGAQQRLERLRSEMNAAHDQTSAETDEMLKIKREQPQ